MKNKKGLLIGGLLTLLGVVGGGFYMHQKAKNNEEVESNEEVVENNESDNEE